MTPWNNIVRLLVPPRMRSGDLLMAILDSLLHRTIRQATQAETFRDNTIALYSNIAQHDVLEELLGRQFPNHNIRIEDTETGSILLFERPDYTPNHTYRQIAGGNYRQLVAGGGTATTNGLHYETRTYGHRPLIVSSALRSFDGSDFIIHQTGLSPVQIEELRHFVRRIVFLGVGFEIVTP